MQTSPPVTRRLSGVTIHTGEPFVIASREQDPDEGVFAYPRLWKSGETFFLNWQFDRDVLDPHQPDKPNGRLSRDGGRTWKRQTVTLPPGHKMATGPEEISSFWHSFAIPGSSGRYRVATWRSVDGGESWGAMTWTEVEYPGTRGMDVYDPPEQYKLHSSNYKGGQQRAAPPVYLDPLFREAGTRQRGPGITPVCTDDKGTLYSLITSHWLPGGQEIADDQTFWEKLDWTRYAVLMQSSSDGGRTWAYRGVTAFDREHRILEFDEESCFAEPTMVIYPDGEMVCVLRTGGIRPLYLVRSGDGGKTWSGPARMPIRGVDPQLVLMPGGVLVLATGRPHCTVHFSLDRGATWPVNEVLFTSAPRGAADRYAWSTCNPELAVVDDRSLLYIHDAGRDDPAAANHWLKMHGFGRIVGRLITLEKDPHATPIDPMAEAGKLTIQEIEPPVALASKRKTDPGLDSGFWEGVRSYHLSNSETGEPPVSPTSFRVAWADNALYLTIRCEDRDMKNINITARRRGDTNLWKGDSVELLIQTQSHTYYQVAINPAGAIVDVDRKEGLNMLWSSGAEATAQLGETFWSLQVRLPLAGESVETVDPLKGIVGRMPSDTDPWRFNLCRQRVRGETQEISAFSPTGYPWFHELTKLGKLYVE